MKLKDYVIFMVLDLVTFGVGSAMTISNILDVKSRDAPFMAGWGVFLITLGFLIRHWTKNLSKKTVEANAATTPAKEGTPTRSMLTVLAVVITLSLFGNVNTRNNEIESSVDGLDNRFERLVNALEDIPGFSYFR